MIKFLKWMSTIFITFSIFSFASCANPTNSSDNVNKDQVFLNNGEDFIYTAQFEKINGIASIEWVCFSDSVLYFTTTNDFSSMHSPSKLYTYDLKTKNLNDLSSLIPVPENSHIFQLGITTKQNLVLVEGYYDSANDSAFKADEYWLKTISPTDGNILSEINITEFLDASENGFINYMAIDKEDHIFLATSKSIFVFSNQGDFLFEEEIDRQWLLGMGVAKDGQVLYACSSGLENSTSIHLIDIEKKETVQLSILQESPHYGGGIATGFANDALIGIGNSVYNYNINDGIISPLFSWSDSSLSSTRVLYFVPLSDGQILAVLSSDSSTGQLAYLNPVPSTKQPTKQIITLGLLYPQTNGLEQMIADYNLAHPEYHFEVINYAVPDQITGLSKLNMDLAIGRGPDIFDLSAIDVHHLVSLGIIENLEPYLAADPVLNQNDLCSSVLSAYTIGDTLCCIPPYFGLDTFWRKTSVIGDNQRLSFEDTFSLLEKYPEVSELLAWHDSNEILALSIQSDCNQYIDWSTGKCSFNSDSFINLLEIAKQYGGDTSVDGFYDIPSKFAENEILLYSCPISTFSDYRELYDIFSEPFSQTSMPGSTTENGATLYGTEQYAINSSSPHKQAAWNFIKSFLTMDYYNTYTDSSNFPTLNSAFKQVMEDALSSSVPYGENSKTFSVTQEDIDFTMKLINDTTTTDFYDYELLNIVQEEAAAYFADQKTAQEVADIIQNRIQLYVNENR